MSKTITIRIENSLRKALEEKARASGTTISQVVRRTLGEAFEERPLAERIGHLRGTVKLGEKDDPWRRRLIERNWRD